MSDIFLIILLFVAIMFLLPFIFAFAVIGFEKLYAYYVWVNKKFFPEVYKE